MTRGVTGIGVAVVLALLIVIFAACAADYIDPPSIAADMNHELGRTAPVKVLATLIKLLGLAGATALGGLIAVRSAEEPGWPAWIVGGAVIAVVIALHVFFPHPIWFLIVRIVVVAAAAVGAGLLFAPRLREA